MSLQKEEQEVLQQRAATIIQRAWKRYVYREVFSNFKDIIIHCKHQDPQTILKSVNPREAKLLDAAAGVFVRFRLGGISFPPNIYYKIFTHRPITDMCASSPKDYTQLSPSRPVGWQSSSGRHSGTGGDRSGWYQRMENNSWRLFCSKAVLGESTEIGAHKKKEFHYSKLHRQQDVNKWRKRRKIEWLKQMYKQGCLQTHPAQEVMDHYEEKGGDDILEWELDELLAWTNTLNFEQYTQEWRCLACSQSSEQSKDPHRFAGASDDGS